VYSQACLCFLAVAAAFSSAAAQMTETAVGASGQPTSYPVSVDAYSTAAADLGIESDFTTSTDGSSTTFTFLVSIALHQSPSRQLEFRDAGA